jgi:hypothetical protein
MPATHQISELEVNHGYLVFLNVPLGLVKSVEHVLLVFRRADVQLHAPKGLVAPV